MQKRENVTEEKLWQKLFEAIKKYNPKHDGVGSTLVISKKNSFKIRLRTYDGSYNAMSNDAFLCAAVFRRTEFGGYKETVNPIPTNSTIEHVVEVIEKCLAWPEIEKTKIKFNKNGLIQNIVGREILQNMDKGGRIKKLAVDDGDACIVSAWSFQNCDIYQDRIRVAWRSPFNIMTTKVILYDMMHPSFNPDLLVKVICRFSRAITHLNQSMDAAWREIENLWHLEKNNESK